MKIPTIGRTVLYVLNATDAEDIRCRRKVRVANLVGHESFAANEAKEGEAYPMVITRTNGPAVNGTVFLDGEDIYRVTSRLCDANKGPGYWHWPV